MTMMGPVLYFVLFLSMELDPTIGKRVFTEEEKELAKNSGLDLNTLSEDTVFITPPKLSDEEQGSKFMPEAYKCDGCRGVAYQLGKHFDAEQKKKKKGDILTDAEVLDVFEKVCDGEFENYGLKNLNDIKTFAGEGLGSEMMSGMIQTGGIWKERMQNICKDLAGMFEEELIYDMYREKGQDYWMYLCRDRCKHQEKEPRDEF